MNTPTPSRLTDSELVAEVKRHAQGTRESTVALIVHLTELESRRIHLAAGFGSLFRYCREELRLAEHAAYHVIKAIRPARRFPLILDKLLDGSLNVSTVRLVAPFLNRQNHEELLTEASGKSKREVEKIVARLSPRPDTPSSIRRLPDPAPMAFATPPMPSAPADLFTTACAASAPSTAATPPMPAREGPSRITPLSPGSYEVLFTADEEMNDPVGLRPGFASPAAPRACPPASRAPRPPAAARC